MDRKQRARGAGSVPLLCGARIRHEHRDRPSPFPLHARGPAEKRGALDRALRQKLGRTRSHRPHPRGHAGARAVARHRRGLSRHKALSHGHALSAHGQTVAARRHEAPGRSVARSPGARPDARRSAELSRLGLRRLRALCAGPHSGSLERQKNRHAAGRHTPHARGHLCGQNGRAHERHGPRETRS